MKTNPPTSHIVTLATTITRLQHERSRASARIEVIQCELDKLEAVLSTCDRAQSDAQREMDKLAAQTQPDRA